MMEIKEIRIYAEVLEQGLDFKQYLTDLKIKAPIKNVYTKKIHENHNACDSKLERLRKSKDVDILISFISKEEEYPVLAIEYSTAVPADDHKMQRSDVYFWGALYKIPVLKIYPTNKGMNQEFGGGDRITDELEKFLAIKKGGILLTVKWDNLPKSELLRINLESPACIYKNKDISMILTNIYKLFIASQSFNKFYDSFYTEEKNKLAKVIDKFRKFDPKLIFPNSTRFHWEDDKLISKINRFGHAMDPDRGVLFFVNMLIGSNSSVSEIQINRSSNINARGGYRSLFDALSRSDDLLAFVQNKINNDNNFFTEQDAIYIFTRALNIENQIQFIKISDKAYKISDTILTNFLTGNSGMTAKSIFFLTQELRLTDKERKIICSIVWDKKPIIDFFESLLTENVTPICIEELSSEDLKEDLITYSSLKIYKKISFDILSVSYPGAQGDRALLVGQGRKVDRVYLDIIAYEEINNKINVYLQENKDTFNKSKKDVDKLKKIKSNLDYLNGLKALFNKTISNDNFKNVFTSIGAKSKIQLPPFDVDYIMMFEINNSKKNTEILWQVAVINLSLATKFEKLMNSANQLRGVINLDKIYRI